MTRLHYCVRDRATAGIDFYVWGVDDIAAALVTLQGAINDKLHVELVVTPFEGPMTPDMLGIRRTP